MSDVKIRFMAGWHVFAAMNEGKHMYWSEWEKKAANTELQGNQLVVFELPQKDFAGAIRAIEELLQARYPLNVTLTDHQAWQGKPLTDLPEAPATDW